LPALLFVTGASGAGKTTLVRALESLRLPRIRCYYFDSIGVPSAEEIQTRFGGPAEWQAFATGQWIDHLSKNADANEVAVLDGQVRPSVVETMLERAEIKVARIALVDCGIEERHRRLHARGQSELATPEMDCWAAYLRGQADALRLSIVDSGRLSREEAVERLALLTRDLATMLSWFKHL
jgi:hypothetical protein